jgi:hypothetical protein
VCGVSPLATASSLGLLCSKRDVWDIMRLDAMTIRDALTLYETCNSIEGTFFHRNHVPLNWITRYMYLCQRFKNPGHQGAVATQFCTVAPNICGYSIWNLHNVTLLAPRILRRDFWNICAWLCVCVCVSVDIIISPQYPRAFVNMVMNRFSWNAGYSTDNRGTINFSRRIFFHGVNVYT